MRRLSERNPISDRQRADSNTHLKNDKIEQQDVNFVPESFLTESQSSPQRMRAASYCPVKEE